MCHLLKQSSKCLQNSNLDVYQRIYQRMESDPTVYTNSNMEGIERVHEEAGSYAYFIESPMAEYITSRTCDITMLGRNLDSRSYGIMLRPGMACNCLVKLLIISWSGSPYRKDLNVALLTLMEKGVLSQLKKKWWDQMDGGGRCPMVLSLKLTFLSSPILAKFSSARLILTLV